jgi:hypothetical protein
MASHTTSLTSTHTERTTLSPGLLTMALGALYLGAAILHLGAKIPLGFATVGLPNVIPQASVAEGLIGGILAAAGGALLVRGPAARGFAWGAYGFALLGTLFGLTIVLLRQLGGPDLWIHFVMLTGLAGGLGLLSTTRRPRDWQPI